LRVLHRLAQPREAFDGGQQLLALLVGGRAVARGQGASDAVAYVVFEQFQRE
jgi:hypothetical protein